MLPRNDWNYFLLWGWHISQCAVFMVWLNSILHTSSQRNGTFMYLEWHLCLFSFKFSKWHIYIIHLMIQSLSLPSAYPTIKMLFAIPNTLGRSLKIFVCFRLNMLPAGATPNDNLVNMYLPNWHANVIRYDFFVKFQL